MLEIKEDIRDECSKLGEITNVVLFDREPEGVASVRFTDAEAAKACVRVRIYLIYFLTAQHPQSQLRFKHQAYQKAGCGRIGAATDTDTDYSLLLQLMNGRWFDERQLEAYIAEGSEKFRKSNEKRDDVVGEGEDGGDGGGIGDESERFDKFGQWLEEEKRAAKAD